MDIQQYGRNDWYASKWIWKAFEELIEIAVHTSQGERTNFIYDGRKQFLEIKQSQRRTENDMDMSMIYVNWVDGWAD